MGEIEIDLHHKQLFIFSNIITYGNAADPYITDLIGKEIENMWNEPNCFINIEGLDLNVVFKINSFYRPGLTDLEIYQNLDPRNNYFRIEDFVYRNISFTDGVKCNSGYFKKENLYKGSTTAAHEFGHTLGLAHPENMDIRSEGTPGIMYPRGTLVDAIFQYDPNVQAGITGGTLNPIYRKVRSRDILNLNIPKLKFENRKAVIGDFTNIWHPDHSIISPDEFWSSVNY